MYGMVPSNVPMPVPFTIVVSPSGARRFFGEPEVEQLHAGLGQHDVAGLQVAMDDAVAMRGVERGRDLDRRT